MKPDIAKDGTRTHTLSEADRSTVRRTLLLVEAMAFHYRETGEGLALLDLAGHLQFLHDGKPLVAPEDEE